MVVCSKKECDCEDNMSPSEKLVETITSGTIGTEISSYL
jgi:hypothetical protein